MTLAKHDTTYHTYGDYLTWPEDVRYELVEGVAYLMAPAPVRVHQECVLEMARQVASALQGKPCRPFIAPFDVRLPKAKEADQRVDTVVQPDLLVGAILARSMIAACAAPPTGSWRFSPLAPPATT